MKKLAALVMLCLLLTAAAEAAGPVFSIWHIDGHGYAWQQAQIDAGLPIEPTIRMPSWFEQAPNAASYVTRLDADASILQKLNGRSIVLRMNNIGPEVDWTIGRVRPLTEENWRTSHMCIRRLADGTLDDTAVISPFAGTTAWTNAGQKWATSLWMARLQQIIPNPSGVILRENNEGGRIKFAQLWEQAKAKYLNHNNVYVWLDQQAINNGLPRDRWLNEFTLQPFTSDWTQTSPTSNVFWRWKTDADLDVMDLRAKEFVGPRRGSYPPDVQNDFITLERAQYRALYAAFDAALAPTWRGKLRTCGYGGWDENRQNDAASPPMYLGFYRDPDITKPNVYTVNRWDSGDEAANETTNPKAWREYSIAVGNPASAVYTANVAGRHAAVDPPSFAGLMTHVAWRMQAPNREVRLVQWDNYNVKPTHFIFATGTNQTTIKQQHIDVLTSIGRTDLINVTIEAYELAVLQNLDRIHDNPILSRYWKDGTTKLLTSPLNTTTATKVFATETTIPGITETLLVVYTPCNLTEAIQVGTHLVPPQRLGYWLTGSSVEIR